MKNVTKTMGKHTAEIELLHHHTPGMTQRASPKEPSEELFLTLCDSSPIGMYIAQDKRLQYVNPKFQELTCFSESELLDTNPMELILPADKAALRTYATAMLKGKRTQPYEYRVFNKAGGVRHIIETVTSIQHRGRPAVLGNYMDVTEHKQANEREQLMALFSELNPAPVIRFDKEGTILMANPAANEILATESMADMSLSSVLPGTAGIDFNACICNGQILFRTVQIGQRHFYLVFRGVPELGIGQVYGSDVTEQMQAEEALRESEEFSSNLRQFAPNPILVLNFDTSIRYVNPAMEELTGFTSDELVGQKAPYPFWPKRGAKRRRREMKEGMRIGRNSFERPFVAKNGAALWVEITSTPVTHDDHRDYYLANIVDITARKRAEEAIRKSEEKYRSIFEKAPLSIVVMDHNGYIIDVNPYHLAEIVKGKFTKEEYMKTSPKENSLRMH